ncbi:MAG: hypothetical protein ACK5QT_05155 [Oligoflexia bacterium]
MLAGHVGKYSRYEIEKKYLLRFLPKDLPEKFVDIHDTYLPHSSLRLRIERAPDGKIIGRKLTKKDPAPDQGHATCIITSLYLSEGDLRALGRLDGYELKKRRYYREDSTNRICVDVFFGKLEGLVLAEIEFLDHSSCARFQPAETSWTEVTGNPKYSGGYLATQASR